ncbi:uncharacterized protein LOC114133074 [Aphis gossypii]|uniref:uncharacterized protein LOC114133074 n=1 Tax=Aphis gossypii TaxID=80765 RepID=UPI002158A30D|nr:uncharacterized protein LOC114133074 [Aphis gossypii]
MINVLKTRFSEESFQVASSVDNLLKLNFEGSSFLIDHYTDLFGICNQSLMSEMSVLRNILGENSSLEEIKQHLTLYDGINFCKIFQVAVTFPVSTATCERSFSTMRRIKTWLRTCMNQDRFSNLSIMNIEKDIPINNEDLLNIFEKTERRIQLH